MRKYVLLLLLHFSSTFLLQGQSCFNVAAGNDTTISCTLSCFTIKARIPDVRTTETYQVTQIPYTPYLYTTPGGTTDPLVNADDHFSDSFFLPFPFCFYGNTYTKICVGSNAVITFDVTPNANKFECFALTASNTLPYAGGSPGNAAFYAPKASIFLAYYDLNPATSPPGNKIEWRVEGSAPCRRFVVSYYHIGYFSNGPATCPNSNPANLCTMQAVLYEGTGLIDVFYENKPVCMLSQSGLAIAGVQNWNQDQSVSPPNTNCAVWTAINQGYRYVPSGPNSLLSRVELYKNGTLISTGTTTPLGNGELEATFPNICQTEDSVSYVVRAFYKQCDNPAIETEGSDTIIVYKSLAIAANVTNAICNGSFGQITVTSPLGPVYEYSINGGTTWQASNIFTVPAGTYSVTVREIATACISSQTVIVTEPSTMTVSSSIITPPTCAGNTAQVNITASGGNPPYQYSLDGGINWQSSGLFSNLVYGNYNGLVKDQNNCLSPFTISIPLIDTMRLDLGNDTTICFGSSITLRPQTNPQTDTFRWTPSTWLNYDTIKNPIATPNDTIRYYLHARWGICQRLDSITIYVLHKPLVDAGKDTAVCYKTNALLNGTATNLSGSVNYSWSPPDSLNTPNTASTIARIDTSRKFILTVTDNYGCNFSVTDSIWVYMMPPVVAFAGNDTNAIRGRPHQLQASGGTNYVWSPAGPLNNPYSANPLATLFSDTYFTVTAFNAIGCSGDDVVFLKVYDGPNYYIPNAFSPNGDGLNDIFRPVPVGIRSTEYFRVYNRYGQLLFETSKWLDGWDGTYKGKKALPGTYTWMIRGLDTNGKLIEMQGTVILIQ